MKTITLIKKSTVALSILTFLSITFSNCSGKNDSSKESKDIKERKCSLTLRNGNGFGAGASIVACDSFQMEGTKKAFIWLDGTKMQVEAEDVIYPQIKWNEITNQIGTNHLLEELFKQAKEMENQQLKEKYDNGYANGQMDLIIN